MSNTSIDSIFKKKCVSVHSEDILHNMKNGRFFIDLPDSIRTVYGLKVSQVVLPRVYMFMDVYENTKFDLSFNGNLYNVHITEGNYTPKQLATELTYRMNYAQSVDGSNPFTLNTPFEVVYHEVLHKFIFFLQGSYSVQLLKSPARKTLEQRHNSTLLDVLGFGASSSVFSFNAYENHLFTYDPSATTIRPMSPNDVKVIVPENPTFIENPQVIYLEIDSFNTMDEIEPGVYNTFRTDGGFCKLLLPYCNEFDDNTSSVDSFLDAETQFKTPLERIKRIECAFRFHNKKYVDFKNQPFSFTLEFICLRE
jgi:hypothetical protein